MFFISALNSTCRVNRPKKGMDERTNTKQVREVPFLIVNSDVTYEDGIHGARFPPFPWAVHQIFRWVYIPQLKAAWIFASCDDWGMPKELAYA